MTGVVARINMDRWEENMLEAIRRMELEIYLFTKYVDDVNMAVSIIPEGWSWEKDWEEGWKLTWKEEQIERDKQRNETGGERTF